MVGRVDNESYSGDFPHILLYDGAGRYVGRNGEGNFPFLDAGGFGDADIKHKKDMTGVSSEYMAIVASNDDGICINYVSMTTPNSAVYGFLGDIGKLCDADWYLSDVAVVNVDSSTTEATVLLNRTSTCFWIDTNYSENGKKSRFQGVGIHVTDFSSSKNTVEDARAKQYHSNKKSMCSSPPRLKFYEKMTTGTLIPIFWPPLRYNSDNSDSNIALVVNNNGELVIPEVDNTTPMELGNVKRRTERSTRKQPTNAPETKKGERAVETKESKRFMPDVLVKSPLEEHRATVLCNSQFSRGPDFVSIHEGVFCDMDKKQTWPICSKQITHACFDLELNDLRPTNKGKREINGREIPKKSYSKELKWGGLK